MFSHSTSHRPKDLSQVRFGWSYQHYTAGALTQGALLPLTRGFYTSNSLHARSFVNVQQNQNDLVKTVMLA
eukprot:3483329-Amphidinium_carterae.1